MKTTPEKSSNEPERLRTELRIQQRTLDAVLTRLKAQEELTNDAWELLAVLWQDRQMAAKPTGAGASNETVSEAENEDFFKGLRLLLCIGRHEDRVRSVLSRMQSRS